MKIKQFYESIYKVELLLLYDCKSTEAEQYLQKIKIERKLSGCSGQTGSYVIKKPQYEKYKYYMYIERDKNPTNILVHEISHLIFMSLDDCGIHITSQTDEIYAYYFEWWFKKLNKSIQ